MQAIELLESTLVPYRNQLLTHPLYVHIRSVADIRQFMESHVFAVWDFMSLLKALQRDLTCVAVPWVPQGSPVARRLINEIVFGEESDVNEEGAPMSHFEMYLEAMAQLGADTAPIREFIDRLHQGQSVTEAEAAFAHLPQAQAFVDFTFDVIATGQLHRIAAVFTFGREDLIPDMFIQIVKNLQAESDVDLRKLIYYLERHIEVDSGEHGPMALQMIQELCGDDPKKWQEATEISQAALRQRIALWDSIYQHLTQAEPARV
ncbi:Protein of unknown function [Catalinimonas alkaloidigena]|uniref:DUF3050 domain-containing protein n=1 Tax=Catalinimonas alkaloidigena TaxID=1075417 RepID=A0A1G9J5Y5_9BACT|nr:DUF3050 domain-containing protein [Catalinimonas alkaloidigena]SDL32920.1 Protein of unknown function [Catalinimonas alkaloidigena]